MDIQSVLKHMSQYWEVYQYVAENGPSLVENIKSYLIEQCHKPESTARGNVAAIKDSPLFKVTDGYVMRNDTASLQLEEILEYIFEWSYRDKRHEEIKMLKEDVKKAEKREKSQKDSLKKKEAEWNLKEQQYNERLANLEKQHREQVDKLEEKHRIQYRKAAKTAGTSAESEYGFAMFSKDIVAHATRSESGKGWFLSRCDVSNVG